MSDVRASGEQDDAGSDEAELAGGGQLAALREEVIALRDEIRRASAANVLVVKRDSLY